MVWCSNFYCTPLQLPLVCVQKLKALAAIDGYNYQYSNEQNDTTARKKNMEVCWIISVTAQERVQFCFYIVVAVCLPFCRVLFNMAVFFALLPCAVK
jgi:hypothetical protein